MLERDYPLYFDNTLIKPRRTSWSRNFDNVTSENQTEDGHDDIEFIRIGKTTISTSFVCSDVWTSILAEFAHQPSINVRFYDVRTRAYVTLEMRITGFFVDEVQYSDRLPGTNGLYEVSFDLVEY